MFLRNREGETPPDCCSHNSKAWAALQANRKERDAGSGGLSQAEEKRLHRWGQGGLRASLGENAASRQERRL